MRPIVAQDLMTPDVLSISETSTVQEAAQYLIDHEISGAVVRNESRAAVGIVTLNDIVASTADDGTRIGVDRRWPRFYDGVDDERVDPAELSRMRFDRDDVTVAEVMTPEIFSVDIDTPAPKIAELMLESHIHRVLVRDADDFVGVISTSDLLGLLVQD